MKKKVAVISVLLIVLMLIPVMGSKSLLNGGLTGNVTNAQDIVVSEDMRGVWIATVGNIDFPSKAGLTSEAQKAEIDEIIKNTEYMGLNAIFFQVRPTGDALYKSSVFPWSKYLTGQQGKANDKDFDPLAYIIEQGHKKGIQIHAWINPLRLSYEAYSSLDKAMKSLAANHPAVKLPKGAVVLGPDGKLYLNPGTPEAIKLISDGVAEIVKNYNVDGIHFDDYFYPSKVASKDKNGKTTYIDFNDNDTYKTYQGSFKNKEDWRRNNIDTLVKNVNHTVKNINPEVEFGVSPFAIWANKDKNPEGSDTRGGIQTYYDHYADTKKWVKESMIDYIAPQIYWNIGFEVADYAKLLEWWKEVCRGTGVKLYTGQAAYKISDASQANDWLDPLQIPKQIDLNRKSNAVSGNILYGYAKLKGNELGIKEKLRGIFVAGREPSNPVPEDRLLFISQPANGYKTTASKVSILGGGDPGQPIYLNNSPIEVSDNGYFTVYVDLNIGENIFTFEHKGQKTEFKVTRNKTSSSSYKMTKAEFKPGTYAPTQTMTMKTGQKVDFSVEAPAGAKVWVEIGKYKVNLENKDKAQPNSDGTLKPVKFTGTFTFPAVSDNQRTLKLGNPVFVLEYQGKKVTSKQNNTISVQSAKYHKYALISTTEAEAVARTGPSTSHSRITPLMNGAVDDIVGQQNGFYLLKSGVWTDGSNVKVVNDKALKTNKISSIAAKENGSYTDITFKMPVNAVFSVDAKADSVILTIFNTAGINLSAAAPKGSIYSSVAYKAVSGNAQYVFKLKSENNYFGYNAEYKNGALVFSLKNAPKISKNGTKPLQGLKVLIDAGHGGTESGAVGPLGKNGLYEKQINLAIALNTRKYLQSLGATVVMTRTTDKTMSLTDRANMIRKEKPDIAVSVHNNSMDVTADYRKHTGLLMLYSKDSSKAAADFIKNEMVNDLERKDSGYRWQSLSVCMVTQSPAILLEGGFMSNPAEYEWLSNYDNQVRMGYSLGKAIENWAYENAR